MILNPTDAPKFNKSKKLDDLAAELGTTGEQIRANEGEAANYGVYYDDTEYDYMQHMRDLGTGEGEAHFIEAPGAEKEKKGKGKKLEDALRDVSLDEKKDAGIALDEEILPSKNLRKVTYQAMQEVPDALTGLQPDMDPRLREVLQALEDEAYVAEDDEDDVFAKLAEDGEELDEDAFRDDYLEEEDEGWESDSTAKPTTEYKEAPIAPADLAEETSEDHGDGDWMAEFSKFKKDEKKKAKFAAPSDLQSSMVTTTTNGGRHKKRKGAMTNPSQFSMTSSSVYRTEGLTDLDARFEKLEEKYNEDNPDDDFGSMASSVSSVTGPVRGDFDGIMDDFLNNTTVTKKKHVKKGGYQSGIDQLDEVRNGLRNAKVRPSFV